MPSDRSLVEREMQRVELQPFTLEGFHRRRERRERNHRIRAGVVAFVVVAITAGAFVPSLFSESVPGDGGDATGGPQVPTPSVAPTPTPGATGSPFPDSTDPVPLEAGTYVMPRSPSSVAGFSVTFPDGWVVQHGDTFSKSGTNQGLGFYAILVDTVFADACEGSAGASVAVRGSSVDDLAAALLEQRGPKASGPVETTLGGFPAIRIDLTVPKGFDLKPCNLPDAFQIWFSHPADGYFVLFPDGFASVYIVDVDGQRQVFQTQYGSAASDEDVRELEAVLDSINIEP
jgi:hypothetical protein